MGNMTSDLDADDIDYDADYRPGFHDFYELMKYRVSKILLVSSLYDAFTLEEDGLIFEQLSDEYRELALPFPPQVIRVSSGKDALEELERSRYDMIITMARISDMDPYEFGKKVKRIKEDIPVILLLTDAGDMIHPRFNKREEGIDYTFFWKGDSILFMAMTKFVEDMVNVDPDIKTGRVKVILVVENNPRFYSVFLPIIYTEIVRQTRRLITEGINEHEKMLRRRARPKILLARDYNEAVDVLDRYRDNMMGIISDISFKKDGKDEEEAGLMLAHEIGDEFPFLLMSTRDRFVEKAKAMGLPFANKNSDKMLHRLRDFFNKDLGFGAFRFRLPNGKVVAKAYDMEEFEKALKEVPAETINLHGRKNEFSKWLTARQEIELAMRLRPRKVSDFRDEEEIRKYLLDELKESKRVKQQGLIIDFERQTFEFDGTFTRLGGGSIGGKGRGIAFLSSLLHQSGINTTVKGCRIEIPDSLVVGTEVFDRFLEENGLHEVVHEPPGDTEIMDTFLAASLPSDIVDSLRVYLENIDHPLAVRSSSLLEDSQNQPFAGIYSTFMLPNSCGDLEARLRQLCQAIKLVYASTFYREARAYIQTTVHMQEEEKMAVVIQKLVGNNFENRFYPFFSGVAQSSNFYPISPLKREDGITSVALGLGRVVVEGEKVLNFSPVHPKVLPGFSTPAEVIDNSQSEFYILDMAHRTCYDLKEGEDATLTRLPISEAEKDGVLDHLASTYDANDDRLRDGIGIPGPRLITFSGILKYGTIPLAEILMTVLDIGKKGFGRDVEIEFAASYDSSGDPTFYIVQIRPLVTQRERGQVVIEKTEKENAVVLTDNALGNGVVQGIKNIVFVLPEEFDKTKTQEIADMIGEVNSEMEGEPYILIGPGRWGTRDRWLGIPVTWDQISGARVIVEVSLPDFRIDPSHGTHFFHNITSLGIPYLTVSHKDPDHVIDWEKLHFAEGRVIGGMLKHVRFEEHLVVKVDGRKGTGVVSRR